LWKRDSWAYNYFAPPLAINNISDDRSVTSTTLVVMEVCMAHVSNSVLRVCATQHRMLIV